MEGQFARPLLGACELVHSRPLAFSSGQPQPCEALAALAPGGGPTDLRHPSPQRMTRLLPVLAAPNKCLAKCNKSRPPNKATNSRNAVSDRASPRLVGRKQSGCWASRTDEPAQTINGTNPVNQGDIRKYIFHVARSGKTLIAVVAILMLMTSVLGLCSMLASALIAPHIQSLPLVY
jgi:hypothetical protein